MVSSGHLTDGSGRTVYLWLGDTGPKSNCTGACASIWTPVTSAGTPSAGSGATATDLSTITGTNQITYAGHPLYYFSQDKAMGDANGQGSNGFGAKWWEVDASGQAITTSAGASSPSAPSTTTSGGGGYKY
jgi:predicted lipoprotein with Yx(FWY)xxD motif